MEQHSKEWLDAFEMLIEELAQCNDDQLSEVRRMLMDMAIADGFIKEG